MRSFVYILLSLGIILVDRVTKIYALTHWLEPVAVNPYLFFQVTFNRGVSWGILNSTQTLLFIGVTGLICLVTAVVIWYAYTKAREGKTILGEVCIIAGSVSNIYDRFLYGGVIDFIAVHKDDWVWPLFNIADACVVFGVAWMFFQLVLYSE